MPGHPDEVPEYEPPHAGVCSTQGPPPGEAGSGDGERGDDDRQEVRGRQHLLLRRPQLSVREEVGRAAPQEPVRPQARGDAREYPTAIRATRARVPGHEVDEDG